MRRVWFLCLLLLFALLASVTVSAQEGVGGLEVPDTEEAREELREQVQKSLQSRFQRDRMKSLIIKLLYM